MPIIVLNTIHIIIVLDNLIKHNRHSLKHYSYYDRFRQLN